MFEQRKDQAESVKKNFYLTLVKKNASPFLLHVFFIIFTVMNECPILGDPSNMKN